MVFNANKAVTVVSGALNMAYRNWALGKNFFSFRAKQRTAASALVGRH
jgi:hypothetical protein